MKKSKSMTKSEIDIKEMQECINLANEFFNDVLPQVGKMVIQDYRKLNELGMALNKLSTPKT